MSSRPGLRKNGYRLGKVLAGMRRSGGGIFLDETTATYGQDEVAVRWYVRKGEGVFKAELSLEDSDPMTTLSGRGIRKVVEGAHGPAGTDRERNAVWPGKRTVILVEAQRMLTGAHIVVTYMRRSEWEEGPVDLPDGWEADDKSEAAQEEEASEQPKPAPKQERAERTSKPPSAPRGQSEMERTKAEAAARMKAAKGAAAKKRAAQADDELPEVLEAKEMLDPSVE
jgi:hypothetical protein